MAGRTLMAKKAPAKRKPPVNAITENAAALAALGKRMKTAREAIEKPPAKRKPRPKKPVGPADVIELHPTDGGTPVELPTWLATALKALSLLVLGSLGGWWAAGGIPIGPGPGPTVNDCLTVAHAADRVTQIAVLKELASQPFDGATDDGREQAGEWFNAQRFRNRADDFGVYTDAVAEAIATNAEAELAKKLEGK